MASRFIPASTAPPAQPPPSLPTASPGWDPSASDVLGLAKSAANLGGQAGRVLDVPGAEYLSAATGPLNIGQGIATGNPVQIASGTLNTATTAANLFGPAGGAGLGTGLGALFGSGAIGAGGAGVAGTMGAAGVGGALAPAAATTGLPGAAIGAGSLAAGSTVGGAGAAAGPALSATLGGLSTVLAPIAILGAIAFNNMLAKKQHRIVNQTQESAAIRKGGQQGLQTLSRTSRFLPLLPGMTPDQLPGLLEQYRGGLAQSPGVQQMIATRGQGGAVSKSTPLDQGTLDAVSAAYYPMLRDTQAGYLWALDAAQRTGQPLPEWLQSFGQSDPAALLNNLSRGYRGTQDMGITPGATDYSQAVPGNLVNFFRQQTAGDPQLAQLFAALPALPGQAPPSEAMAQQAGQRQQQAQAVAQQASAHQGGMHTGGKDIEALAYTSPYTPGGLQASLIEAFSATPAEQAIITDLLARGGDPVGIRSAILAHREQGGSAGGE